MCERKALSWESVFVTYTGAGILGHAKNENVNQSTLCFM